ncbi:MAG: ArnT family glycosyltransferase [Methylococcales bacterium]
MSVDAYIGQGAWVVRWLFRGLLILVLLTACASLTWPFGWDQGIFAWVGDVIYRGGLPYRDGWDIKGPLVYYLYAFAQCLFGPHTWSIRLVDMILLAAACQVLLRFVTSWTNRQIAAWATLLFCLWYASGSYWHTAQPDGWVMMLMIPVAARLLQPQREIGWFNWWLSGALIGCAVLIKFFYACFLLVPVMAAFLERDRPAIQVKNVLIAISGLILPTLLAVSWFWQQGALKPFIEVTLRYPADTYSTLIQSGIESRLRGLIDFLSGGTVVAAVLPFVLFGLYVAATKSPRLAGGLLAWIAVSVGMVMLQNRFFTYHWMPLFPAVVISAAIGLHTLFESLNAGCAKVQNLRNWMIGSLLLVLVFHVSALPAYEVLHWLAYLTNQSGSERYFKHFGEPADDIAMARLLSGMTRPDDQVVIFGWNSAILFLSQRTSPTRFGFSMPLLQGTPDSPWFTRYRHEFMQALHSRRPVAIVVGTQSQLLLGSTFTLADFPEFAEFVRDCYDTGHTVGSLTLYLNRTRVD